MTLVLVCGAVGATPVNEIGIAGGAAVMTVVGALLIDAYGLMPSAFMKASTGGIRIAYEPMGLGEATGRGAEPSA
jgi:hypothetical protein